MGLMVLVLTLYHQPPPRTAPDRYFISSGGWSVIVSSTPRYTDDIHLLKFKIHELWWFGHESRGEEPGKLACLRCACAYQLTRANPPLSELLYRRQHTGHGQSDNERSHRRRAALNFTTVVSATAGATQESLPLCGVLTKDLWPLFRAFICYWKFQEKDSLR